MDVSDPQTLGFMVFGGFMVLSALGILLVSTLSMKETSYEEALAKQRREIIQNQNQRSERKKKDRPLEKKNKAKKREDQPDGNLSEPGSDSSKKPEVMTSAEPDPDPEPALEPKAIPESEPEPVESLPAPSPKDRKKKPAWVEPATVVESAAKKVLVLAIAPVSDVHMVPEVSKEPSAAKPEPTEAVNKKKKSKNKPEQTESPVTSPLISYSSLMSAVSNMVLTEDETNKLVEVLNQRAGVHHESWQLACQKGDPLPTLKKQLEDKEKLLISKQEAAAAAQRRLQELSKELCAEKSKTSCVEARLSAEQSARVQEAKALRTKIETCEKENQKHTQQLNQKISRLQEQLEKGPNAQLVRLQQENSILRDALNQATSQAESRQNAELARLKQDCVRLGQELTERTNALRASEVRRKSLEAKMATSEQELARVKVERSSDVEQLRIRVQHRDEQAESLKAELTHLREELHQLTSSQTLRVKLSEAEAAHQTQNDESGSETESDQAFESLEKDSQLLRLEEELQQAQNHSMELQEELSTAERQSKQREAELKAALTEAESRLVSLSSDFQAALQGLFPGVYVEADQRNWLQLFTEKVQKSKSEAERSNSELQLSLKDAEQKLKELEAQFDPNAKLLLETEAELRSLQQQTEEEKKVWKNKLSETEHQKQTVRGLDLSLGLLHIFTGFTKYPGPAEAAGG
ncbi:ribosome-binding protein 1b isoform X2 [Channa argus]|uniref:ribosome-binding protein 1b isoform X2 n=1 Tax=Channa argus TaxID=215402 RepID=UPI003520C890